MGCILGDVVVVQQTEGSIPLRCHHHRSVARTDQARVFAKHHIRPPMEAILGQPMTTNKAQELLQRSV
jgi:hypothetical protein